MSCILFSSYIKPQQQGYSALVSLRCILFSSYIKPQQVMALPMMTMCCILFSSYIKPQPFLRNGRLQNCCILFSSYIKPQRTVDEQPQTIVVSYLVPTSNHNRVRGTRSRQALYLI